MLVQTLAKSVSAMTGMVGVHLGRWRRGRLSGPSEMRHNRASRKEDERGKERAGDHPQDGQQFSIMGDEDEQLEDANAGDDPGAPLAQDANPARILNAREWWHTSQSFLCLRAEMMPRSS